ncbi:hypothetical protein [Alicyclobacillus mengziensis]|uniref:hypothetical protein n=1 Tax=Alicyclobacillus mengziensis TaxID=2931921 RepID=UPI0020114102|nr:hypothetical protein [Alicyclobacillus mengziensis]
MNRITVYDAPTDRIRKKRSELYEDRVMRAWLEAREADSSEQTLERGKLAGNRAPRTQVTKTTGQRSRAREAKSGSPYKVAHPHELPR